MGSHTSLKTKSVRVIMVVSLLLLLIGGSAGFVLYGYGSLHNYKSESRHLIAYTLSLQDMEYIEKIFAETKKIYSGLPVSVRDDMGSDEFYDAYKGLLDDDFFAARELLVKCRETTEQRNMCLVFADEENQRLVYVVDGDVKGWAYIPGQWVPARIGEISAIEDSSWRLMITHSDDYGWIGTDYKPLYSSGGDMIGYAVMDLDLNDFLNRISTFLVVLLPVAVVLVAALALISRGLLGKYIISPLSAMSKAAGEYIAEDKVSIDEETPSVFEPLGINTSDELETLWRSMTEMESDFKNTMIRLREMTAEREHAEAELEIAAKIQTGMLPDKFPEDSRFALYASMDPAKEVGGDLYDFFMIDDDHVALVIADVSGKGISASLFMVTAKNLIKNQTEQGLQDPAVIFARVNRQLAEVNKARMFVTAWLGILAISTGEIVYVNAGHEYPTLRTGGGSFEVIKDIHGVPLGARKKMKFESGRFCLGAGDALFVYTDGVTEAVNAEGEFIGRGRMLEALNREPDADPETIIKNMQMEIADFVKDAPQFDDTTMLCVKYYGKEGK